ncbi:hypothetical protein BJ546DRAFT_981580 [Cryomyces antarcticus]
MRSILVTLMAAAVTSSTYQACGHIIVTATTKATSVPHSFLSATSAPVIQGSALPMVQCVSDPFVEFWPYSANEDFQPYSASGPATISTMDTSASSRQGATFTGSSEPGIATPSLFPTIASLSEDQYHETPKSFFHRGLALLPDQHYQWDGARGPRGGRSLIECRNIFPNFRNTSAVDISSASSIARAANNGSFEDTPMNLHSTTEDRMPIANDPFNGARSAASSTISSAGWAVRGAIFIMIFQIAATCVSPLLTTAAVSGIDSKATARADTLYLSNTTSTIDTAKSSGSGADPTFTVLADTRNSSMLATYSLASPEAGSSEGHRKAIIYWSTAAAVALSILLILFQSLAAPRLVWM